MSNPEDWILRYIRTFLYINSWTEKKFNEEYIRTAKLNRKIKHNLNTISMFTSHIMRKINVEYNTNIIVTTGMIEGNTSQ